MGDHDQNNPSFFRRSNCQNVIVKHKSHLCVNKNFFSYDIAVVMLLLINTGFNFCISYWAGYDLQAFYAGLRETLFKKCQPVLY